jgi:WD40 repeat protein
MNDMKKLMASLPPLPAIRKTPEKSAYYMELHKKLLEACQKGELKTLRELIETPTSEPIDFNQFLNEPTGSYKWTPLMVASYYGHLDIIDFLINHEAKIDSHRYKVDIHYQTPSGATAIDFANKANERKHAKSGVGTEDEKVKAKEAIEAHTKALQNILTKEKTRQERINKLPTKQGFHETSNSAFQFILQDVEKKRYPMVGGDGGYFGGGIYFAKTTEESTRKALSHGHGFQCTLKMGKCLKIKNEYDLMKFYMRYCYIYKRDDSYDGHYKDIHEIRNKTDPYNIAIDVMQSRLLEDDYDSVWGIQDKDVSVNKRILKTGDEYVVYSADQVVIDTYFIVNKINSLWTEIPNKSVVEMKKFHSVFKRNWDSQLNSFYTIAFAPSKSYIAIGVYTNVYIWDLKQNTYVYRFNIGDISTTMVFSPDESSIAVAITKKKTPSIYLIDYADQSIEKTFDTKHTEIVYSLAYTPDGRYLVSAGKDGYLVFWRTQGIEQEPIVVASNHASPIIELFLTNKECIYYDTSNTISMMNYLPILSKDAHPDALNIHQYKQSIAIGSFAISFKRKLIAFGNIEGSITLLNLETGTFIQAFVCPEKNITKIEFSPNGNYLMTASAIETRVFIWNIKDLKEVPFMVHSFDIDNGFNNVELLRFSKNGHELICGLKKGYISGWNVKDLLD